LFCISAQTYGKPDKFNKHQPPFTADDLSAPGKHHKHHVSPKIEGLLQGYGNIDKKFGKHVGKHCAGSCNGMKVCRNDSLYAWCILNCSEKMNTQHICGKVRFNSMVDFLKLNEDRLSLVQQQLLANVIRLFVPIP
jgi:hypothetical protein